MLVAIVGATGTGKSSLSLDVAERLGERGRAAEIVNADAMQLYRGMDIGTAKLPLEDRRGIRHHLLDVLDIGDESTVAAYQTAARTVIEDILGRDTVPILVGGSGLYVSSVLWNFRFPGTDAGVRAGLEAELAESGPGVLYQRLSALDPAAAASIGPRNGRRLVRALEVIRITGERFGSGLPDESSRWRDSVILGLKTDRDILVPRLDDRVRRMWSDGLLDEVRALEDQRWGVTAERAIGYAQARAQLAGELTESQAIEQAAALTRRYARRQVGWFRRYPVARWLDSYDASRVQAALDTIDA